MASLTPFPRAIHRLYTQLATDGVDFDFDDSHGTIRAVIKLEQTRREKQRERMAHYRRKKKESVADMAQERQRLEMELQAKVAASGLATETSMEISQRSLQDAFRELRAERAKLAQGNVMLRQQLERYRDFRRYIRREHDEFIQPSRPEVTFSLTSNVQCEHKEGWRVHFPNKEPSFEFHPFSRREFDEILNLYGASYVNQLPRVRTVGTILGWQVDLAQTVGGPAYMAHTRFTKRLSGSVDDANKKLQSSGPSSRPMLVPARSCGRTQAGKSTCQVLQTFAIDAQVVVCNIPTEVHLRYLALVRHLSNVRSDGKRVDTYAFVIADSEANARSREAEGPVTDVQWVFEGGCFVTFSEVDDDTTEVVYDHWARCVSEAQGCDLYIDWVNHVVNVGRKEIKLIN